MNYRILYLILSLLLSCHQPMKKKLVIAHRGASGYLPEHTLESKKLAFSMNADYIEQDVVLSKDDVPVVIHDIYLDDVTDVAQKFPQRQRADGRFYVIDFDMKELRTLQVSERFDPKSQKQVYPNRYPMKQGNFHLHSLEEEIELIQKLNKETGKQIGIYPEIKEPGFHQREGKDLTAVVLKVLTNYGYTKKSDPCILQCFDANELERIRTELHSDLFLVQLIDSPDEAKRLAHYATYADGIGPWYQQIVAGKKEGKWQFSTLVSEAKSLGLKVHAYTFRADALGDFSSFEELLQTLLIEADIDGAFTDFPDKVVNFLKEKESYN